jgi:hypothetical protein
VKTIGTILFTLSAFGGLSGFFAPRCGAAVYQSDGSAASVQGLHNWALNGDTITLPAGTFTWSTPVTISKAITLQGQGIGITVIRDAVQSGPLMTWNLVTNQASRMTGIEFRNGGRTVQTFSGIIPINGIAYDNRTMRIDHCKFDHLNGTLLVPHDVIGVIDHNIFLEAGKEAIQVWNTKWGGGTFGNGSWMDTNHFGTSRFIFIEDNAFIYGAAYGAIDAYGGARYVARHNIFANCHHGGHGTEGQRNRGMRAVESYNNRFIGGDTPGVLVNMRSGVALIHDNIVSGGNPGVTRGFALNCYRTFRGFDSYWGGADGQSHWDINQTGGPFYSGTASSGGPLTVTVAGAAWSPGQWIGYSIAKTSNLGDNNFSQIKANTSNTITFLAVGAGRHGANMRFASGDTFSIYKVNQALDQPGRSGGSPIAGIPPVPPPGWNNQVTDPCYEWNNIDTSSGQTEYLHFKARTPIRINEHYFNNTRPPGYTPYVYPHPLVKAIPTDFNNDGKPDFVLSNASTHQTAVWYMNNNVHAWGAYGPTLPAGWSVVGVADFNSDGHPDYALFNLDTRQTGIRYLSGVTNLGGAYGPTLPSGWELVGTGDFNGDGKPDFVLHNASTHQTVVWYMNNNVHVWGAYGPTLAAGWSVVGVADFNNDGHPDYALFNLDTRQTGIRYLSGVTNLGGAYGPTLPSGWELVGTGDFNGDGKPDFVLYNASTHQTALWNMNNNIHIGSAYGPTLPPGWSVVAP